MDALQIVASGTTVMTGAASARVTIPNCGNGTAPKYIRVAATTESYVRIGDSSVAATTNDVMVQPADAVILAVSRATNIAYIQGTSVGKVNIVPVENQ